MRRYEGRVVLVTGAGSGIGRATVLRLVDEGATVVAADIAEDGLADHRQGRRAARGRSPPSSAT